MLAIADAFGNVFAAIPGLASVANVTIEAAQKAVDNLLAPDEWSRTKDFEGRRIEEIDGGWHILNYGKYRKMMDEEERREYKAKWARESRRQKRTSVDSSGQAGTERRPSGHRQRQSTEGDVLNVSPNGDTCPSVGEIYDAYPRHEKRPKAIAAIEKALKKFPADFVLERTKLYASTRPPNSQYTPLPATWFNAEQFNDDPCEWQRDEGKTSKPKKPWDARPKRPEFGELYGT